MGLEEFLEKDFDAKIKALESTSKSIDSEEISDMSTEELVVWPWMVVVANIPDDSGEKLKDEWIKQGYNPIKVHPLWSRLAVVEFGKEWDGFGNAMMFVKAFEVDKYGRKYWYDGKRCKDDKLYAWIAGDEDYNSNGLVGYYLRKNGVLKTVSEIEKEDEVNYSKLVVGLKTLLEENRKKSEEIESEISRTDSHMASVIKQKEMIIKEKEMKIENFNRDVNMMQEKANGHFQKIANELQQSKLLLEDREKKLRACEAINESEQKKLDHEKKMNELAILAILEKKKANDGMLKLANEHKREKEKHLNKIMELQKKLDDKQRLELEIEMMKGTMEIMKYMSDEDVEAMKKFKSIQEDLKEKEEELESLEELTQALVIKKRLTNDELQDTRKELISGLRDNTACAHIGVKRMGGLDAKPFIIAAKRLCATEKERDQVKFVSLWEARLRDRNWHPFKVFTIEGECKEVLNEEDEKIASLKAECDEDVYNAVVTALNEMNQYNPNGRYPLPELWNNTEKRKATLKEGVEYILKQWKTYKQRKC